MEITREQIKTLAQQDQVVEEYLEEWFPEAFKLELNKWYWIKNRTSSDFVDALVYLQDSDTERTYGFNHMFEWSNKYNNQNLDVEDILREATESEVKEALVNEAQRRGFVEGVEFKSAIDQKVNIAEFDKPVFYFYDCNHMALKHSNGVIYSEGVWATIQKPQITRSKAEELLENKYTIID